MPKLYKSFSEISNKYLLLENSFAKQTQFLAHTHAVKKNESLHEHIIKVKEYFMKIVKVNNLEQIIDKLIFEISFGKQEVGEALKIMFFQTIIFHDFGKVNDNFQAERMNNSIFKTNKSIKIGYEHSFLSAYFFLNYKINEISLKHKNKNEQLLLYVFAFLFCIPILKHHSSYLEKDYDFTEEKTKSIQHFLDIIKGNLSFEQISNLINFEKSDKQQNLWTSFNNEIKKSKFDYFSLFALLKLNYSLLTASDYYATSEYMNGNDLKFETEQDFGLLTDKLKQEINTHFTNNKSTYYNGKLVNNTDFYLNYPHEKLQIPNNDSLNILRQKLGAEVLKNIEKHKNERIFYIEAPTGGGKTNMSMIAIYKMLQIHPEINKIFYVFPFTTLITQTAKSIKETLGLTENEVTQVHSKAGFQTKDNNNEHDAKYGNERRNQIDNLFINYPLTLLTHIKFFDILKSNRKDTNYILHRLANSVVIIDELQAYSPEHWDKIKFYISKYAEFFNIRFIIMSATLPKIDRIKMGFENVHFEPLINDAKKYLQNPNFAKRVSIKTDLLDKKKIDLKELAQILLEKSENYAQTRTDKYKISIYTIIEFIFKKSASEFYEIINELEEKNKFFDKIFVLSGTIIEPRRKYIIEYLKDENNRKKKILLITTQVVEAGVDIDMDLGFKNQSLIDSDEQLAGRINRNVKKQNCELWLFRADTAKSIYGKDDRYKVTTNFSPDYIKDILTNKTFEKLYDKVFQEIDKLNTSGYKTNFNTYYKNFENIDFREINDKFKLIDSENASIFIPADINIHCYGTENNFSESELKFIRKNDCLEIETKVSGEKIWDLYVSFIQDKNKRFSSDLKILNGIMSKFVFSVFMKKANDLQKYCKFNEEYDDYKYFQYYKFEKEYIGENKIYDLYAGINEKLLEKELKRSFEFI